MEINGGCYCGDIIFRADVDPDQVLICHCSDCQTLSGSAYRTVVPALDGSFKLLQGELKIYLKIAANGTPREQAFCPKCGSSIYSGPQSGKPGMLGIRVGTIAQRDHLTPKRQYWCKSAQGWVQNLSDIPIVDGE